MAVISDPARTSSNDVVNCPAPSRIRNRNLWVSPTRMTEVRAAWVVHGPVGTVDLAFEYQDLVAEGEDLRVAPVTGGEHPSEA